MLLQRIIAIAFENRAECSRKSCRDELCLAGWCQCWRAQGFSTSFVSNRGSYFPIWGTQRTQPSCGFLVWRCDYVVAYKPSILWHSLAVLLFLLISESWRLFPSLVGPIPLSNYHKYTPGLFFWNPPINRPHTCLVLHYHKSHPFDETEPSPTISTVPNTTTSTSITVTGNPLHLRRWLLSALNNGLASRMAARRWMASRA